MNSNVIRALVVAAAATGIIAGATVTAPMATASGPYRNCTEAHKDGRYSIPKGDPDYQPKLDRDNDGLACEG
ncbi:excalibur calcium-binding domain-containing protein [Mycobacterium sp.]|uniref:excalibur calcium-binding domain-containing protein n=1 Tax=Mycobacterium sp. TaxID=1785 RepID=UPI003F814DF1